MILEEGYRRRRRASNRASTEDGRRKTSGTGENTTLFRSNSLLFHNPEHRQTGVSFSASEKQIGLYSAI
jgi:hypothetical protein